MSINAQVFLPEKWIKSSAWALMLMLIQCMNIHISASALDLNHFSRTRLNHVLTLFIQDSKTKSFAHVGEKNDFKMQLNMKNINNFNEWKNGSVDMTIMRAIMEQKHLTQSGRSALDIFNVHSVYLLKSQSVNKKLSWSVWMCIK